MGYNVPTGDTYGFRGDGLWAWRDIEAKIDFAYRATHRTALVGKAIVSAFYAQPAKRSYFMGCSTGGRQGLVSAQRFPEDFDGERRPGVEDAARLAAE